MRLLVTLALAGCLPPGLFATTCFLGPPCEVLRPGSVLFVGTMLGSVPDPSGREGVAVRFKIEERFAGVAPGVEELIVSFSGTWMQKGVQYLVDAYRLKDGSASVVTCGQTQEADSEPAEEVIKYLRAQVAGKARTRLTVQVEDTKMALPGATVSISGPGGTVERTTDSDGYVVLEDAAPGSYRISASLQGYRQRLDEFRSEPVTLQPGGCASGRVFMLPDGRVSGFLQHFDGRGAPRVRLSLVEETGPDSSPESYDATTDAEGRFVFSNVSPGTYLLGANIDRWTPATVPRTWYPASRNKAGAFPIQVEVGKPVENLAMVLPDLGPVRKVRVCMVDQLGKPIPGARVGFPVADREDGESVWLDGPDQPDASGCLLLTGYSSVSYRLGAGHSPPQAPLETVLFSDIVTIPPGEGPVERVLVLKPHTAR